MRTNKCLNKVTMHVTCTLAHQTGAVKYIQPILLSFTVHTF